MSDLPVILIGAGSHAKVLIDALQCAGCNILFALDSTPEKTGTTLLGVSILGDETMLADHSPKDTKLVNGVGSAQSCAARRDVYLRLKSQGWRFAQVIHPSAIIAKSATLGEGAQILAGAVVQPLCSVGDNAIINTRASIDHDCRIGAHAHIAPGSALSGGVHIGEATHIGVGCSVIQNIRIGSGTLIGAGSVVVKNVPDGVVAYGVPAKVIRKV
ncbi:MAG: acetyltransferase [Phycisphaeraceae bacterium]